MAELLDMRAFSSTQVINTHLSHPASVSCHSMTVTMIVPRSKREETILGENCQSSEPSIPQSSLPGSLPRITCSRPSPSLQPCCQLPFLCPPPFPTPQEVNFPNDLSQTPARTSVAARCSAVKAAIVKSPPRPDPTDAEEAAISVKPSVDLFMTPTAMAFPAKRVLSRSRTTSDGAYTQRSIVHSHTSGYLGSGGHQISPSASESARVRRLPQRTAGLSRGSPDAQTGESTLFL